MLDFLIHCVRARLNGPMTPIVVWPEHFDLSFLWFASAQATDRFPHMNFGCASWPTRRTWSAATICATALGRRGHPLAVTLWGGAETNPR